MKRQTFLTIAAVISVLFGVVIFRAGPRQNDGRNGNPVHRGHQRGLAGRQYVLICIGLITFLARKDEGSIALRAIIIGSIVMHVVLLPIDWIAYQRGIFPQISGFLQDQSSTSSLLLDSSTI